MSVARTHVPRSTRILWYPLLIIVSLTAGGAVAAGAAQVNLSGVLLVPIGLAVLLAVTAAVPGLAATPFLTPLLAGLVLLDSGLALFGYLLIGDVLLLGAMVMWLFARTRRTASTRIEQPHALYIFIGLYLAGNVLSTAAAVDLGETLSVLVHFTLLWAILTPLLIQLFAREERAARLVLPAMLVAATFHSVGVLALVVGGLSWTGPRIAGIFGSDSQYLVAVGLVGCVAVIWLERRRRLLRLGAFVALPLIAAALAILRFRGAWVAALVGVLTFLWVAEPRRRVRGIAVSLAVLAGLWLAYQAGLFPAAVQERIDLAFDATAVDVRLRIASSRELIGHLMDSPLIGVGLGQSEHHLPAGYVVALVGSAHNVVLNAAIEGGLIAGIGFVGSAVSALVYGWGSLKRAPTRDARLVPAWAFASVVGVLAGAQFTPTIYVRTFFVTLAVMIACGLRPKPRPDSP